MYLGSLVRRDAHDLAALNQGMPEKTVSILKFKPLDREGPLSLKFCSNATFLILRLYVSSISCEV